LNEVAELMETDDVGAVPLVEGDRLVGIVTDRDIVVRAIAKDKDLRGMPALDVSSRELLTVSPDDDPSEALKLMAQYQAKRLAVTAEDDRLFGVVSQADVACKGKTRTRASCSSAFRESRACAHPDVRVLESSLSRCHSRNPRVVGSGSATRTAFCMWLEASAAPERPPDVYSCECVSKHRQRDQQPSP
jgi:CBS-domain-containing membrane protein